MENIEQLREENYELKKVLAICMNKPLLKKLAEALRRINSGEYLTEEEFFKGSPLRFS